CKRIPLSGSVQPWHIIIRIPHRRAYRMVACSCPGRQESTTLRPRDPARVSIRRTIVPQTDSHGLATELEFVKALTRAAAEAALARCRQVTPHEKANLSYVTDLDNDLERLIRGRLGARFPEDVLTGEEYGAVGGSGPRRWSIDPIDGTGNLVH